MPTTASGPDSISIPWVVGAPPRMPRWCPVLAWFRPADDDDFASVIWIDGFDRWVWSACESPPPIDQITHYVLIDNPCG